METSGRVRNSALVALGIAGLGAAAVGALFYTAYNATIFWNLADDDHRWYYIHPVLYGATAVVAIVATVVGARGVKSPARPLWALLPWALVVLILLTLWACAESSLARVYLV